MKKQLFIGLTSIVAVAAVVCVTLSVNNAKSTQSSLMIQNLEALTDPEGGGNTQNGPGEEVKCKGLFSGHKKICLAYIDTTCIETDCY
jgi:hypothetical protein